MLTCLLPADCYTHSVIHFALSYVYIILFCQVSTNGNWMHIQYQSKLQAKKVVTVYNLNILFYSPIHSTDSFFFFSFLLLFPRHLVKMEKFMAVES